nr:EOG090X0856 [Ilyocryptus agilis]
MICRIIFLFVIVILFPFASVSAVHETGGTLELVDDANLEKLVANEKAVVALFRPGSCTAECDELEALLSSIREDLVDSLNAWVVKLVDSNFVSNFSDTGKPFIAYYRHGSPMLYDGPLNDETMLDTFTQNQEVVVSRLSDETFEHLTQAASGATTGDWFVMFYRDDCDTCMKFRPKWEYIASQLKGRINLAEVNIMNDGISTGSRFAVEKVPTFLL